MKNDSSYSLSRKDYYERLVTPKNVSFFNDLRKDQKGMLRIDIPVIFRDLHFGASPRQASPLLGEPRYVVESSGISSRIFFYKESISNHRIITQLHFLNEEFFYACYSFRHTTPAETASIRKLLFEKYSKMNGDTAEKYDHMIDSDNNVIRVYDNVNFNIVYLWGNNKVADAVASHIRSAQRRQEIKVWSKVEDLRNKL